MTKTTIKETLVKNKILKKRFGRLNFVHKIAADFRADWS